MDALSRFDAALALDLVDLLLVVFAAEAMLIALWRHRRATTPGLLGNLAAGAALVMALRSALEQAPLIELLLWLTVAGVSHALALWRSAQDTREPVEAPAAERRSRRGRGAARAGALRS